jgi:hypothetical protein
MANFGLRTEILVRRKISKESDNDFYIIQNREYS